MSVLKSHFPENRFGRAGDATNGSTTSSTSSRSSVAKPFSWEHLEAAAREAHPGVELRQHIMSHGDVPDLPELFQFRDGTYVSVDGKTGKVVDKRPGERNARDL